MAARLNGRFIKREEFSRRKTCLNMPNWTQPDERSEHIISENKDAVVVGNRLLKIAEVIKQLTRGCEDCKCQLNLTNIVADTKCGLGSIYYIQCECGVLNKINSGTVHFYGEKKKQKPIFDINTQAVTGKFSPSLQLFHDQSNSTLVYNILFRVTFPTLYF